MLNRESRFPSDDRQTSIRRQGRPVNVTRRSKRIYPVFLILALAAGLYLYEMPERPLFQLLDYVQRFLSEREPNHTLAPESRKPSMPRVAPKPAVKSRDGEIANSKKRNRVQTDTAGVTLDLPIGMGFRPVGFRIGAVSTTIALSDKPMKRIRRLPAVIAERQKFGVIKLGPGREYAFAIDLAASGYRMHLDRNRNGNLADDGPALLNRGKGLFATRLKLPLSRISGVKRLKGDYQLWIYTNPDSWKQGRMHYYSMTQLMGELVIKGTRYKVFLADNAPLDGDYRNDGVNIDLNRDGKISRNTEFFPMGKPVTIGGETYNFRIIR